MPFNGSGSFSIINTFVPNTTILSTAVNQNYSDIATGLSDCLTRDGQAGMTATLQMGANFISGVKDPVSTQDGATKNYVDTQNLTVWSTGDVKLTLKTVADSGWVLFTDGTIGDASSGATVASSTTSALFTLLYASPFTDSSCPLFTSTGSATTRAAQGTAAAAYAAHCRISTPAVLGRAMALAGAGSGLTARTLGTTTGTEGVTLTLAQLPTGITSSGSNTITSTPANGGSNIPSTNSTVTSVGVAASAGFDSPATGNTTNWLTTSSFSGTTTINVTSNNTSGSSTSIMQPTSFLNAMVKL